MMAAADDMPVRGELRRDEPMSRHTSWRAGGPAELFFVPADIDDLQAFLRSLDATVPIFWHGVGSNLLVRDGGIRGVTISATRILKDLQRTDPYTVRAGSGAGRAKCYHRSRSGHPDRTVRATACAIEPSGGGSATSRTRAAAPHPRCGSGRRGPGTPRRY